LSQKEEEGREETREDPEYSFIKEEGRSLFNY